MRPQEFASASAKPRRSYATPKRDQRAAATRAKILAAAETLFLRNGYVRTSMKAIAESAGVSEKTMYLAFSTKATLLRQVIQLSVRGDEEETPLSERSEWRQLLAGPVEQVFARFAAQNAALMTRTAALIALGEAAAATDPELAEYRDRAHAETRANLRAFARRTQPARRPQRRRQRTIRRRHHLRSSHRRKRLPPPDPRMRLDTGRLRRPHHPHPKRPPRENTAFLVRIAAIACSMTVQRERRTTGSSNR